MASDKHKTSALAIVGNGWGRELQGMKATLCAEIATALEAAEREGREDERKRCAEIARRAHVAHAQWSDTYDRDIAAAILSEAKEGE